jgi:putative ABC transport system ATP-binding protein
MNIFSGWLFLTITWVSPLKYNRRHLISNDKFSTMLRLNNIHKSYHTGQSSLHVLKGVEINIRPGEFVSIMGSSGSGKSTLLNILGILDNYDSGEYHLDDVLMRDLPEKKAAYYRNKMIGFVFQAFNLINYKNAVENVALPLYYQGVGRKTRNKIALEYLDKMGLRDWALHLPSEMSGGQKQRVAIARSLITKPKIILADEPTGALDTQTSYEVMEVLREVNEQGITVIIVTHEHDISAMTKKIVHLRDGQIESVTENTPVWGEKPVMYV